jgi:quinol monooxygenase YgiN
MQVPRPQPFPQLPLPAARFGFRVAFPGAEEMLAMRLARAIAAWFILRWSHRWPLLLDSTQQLVLRMWQQLRVAPGQAQSVGNNSTQESKSMEAIGLLVALQARPGKEADAEAFLKSAQPLALKENGTLKWYAIKLGSGKFGIFDTFANEGGRNAHLSGEIAKALGARANELFATPPQIEKVEILASTPLKD